MCRLFCVNGEGRMVSKHTLTTKAVIEPSSLPTAGKKFTEELNDLNFTYIFSLSFRKVFCSCKQHSDSAVQEHNVLIHMPSF